jgi:hypothetical protein
MNPENISDNRSDPIKNRIKLTGENIKQSDAKKTMSPHPR